MQRLLLIIFILTLSHLAKAQTSRYSKPAVQPQISVTPPMSNYQLELMRQALEAKQAAYDQEQERMKQEESTKVAECSKMVEELYKSATSYPTISDGWHNIRVIATTSCGYGQVLVTSGKVAKWKGATGELTPLAASAIQAGKCLLELPIDDASFLARIYFIEDILK